MAVANPHILAIDLGTSGPKVGLATSQGEILAVEFEPVPLYLFPGGGAEQDPNDWWRAICTAANRVHALRLVDPGQITAVCCTAQWSGTVAVGPAGQPLMNAVIWMDTRGAPHIQKLLAGVVNLQGYDLARLFDWIRFTGGIPGHAGKDPISHILYLKNELPEVYAAAARFLEPKDYLNFRLTGRLAATPDSICLHWLTDNRRIQAVDYHPLLLRWTGIPRSKLPDICRSTDILGPLTSEAARDLGLSPEVQVVAGSPDLQSTAVGSGAVDDYAAHLYIGTSSWLACHVPYKRTDLLHNMASLPSAIPGRYLLTNAQECAGICLNYLRDNIFYPPGSPDQSCRPADVYAAFNSLAESAAPGSGKLIFTPWLYGERTPVDDHAVRGGFLNQTLQTTRAEMVRSVFEGVAYNSRWLLQYVEKFIRRTLEVVHITGGGANSSLWCQIHADVFNRPVRQVQNPSWTSLRGAVHLAAVGMGYAAFGALSASIPFARTYQPIPENRRIYDELFREYVNIYKQNKGMYARLNT